MNNDGYTWDLDPKDRMIIVVKHNGIKVISMYLGEAIESAGRENIMRHVRECDRSPWLHRWNESAMDEEVRILQGKNQEK